MHTLQKFKNTTIGQVPIEWEIRKGEDLFIISGGASASKIKFNNSTGNILYVQVEDMNLSENAKYIITSRATFDHSENSRVPLADTNSIIFPKRGAAILTNKVRILGKKSTVDPNVMVLKCKSLVDPNYMYYNLINFKLYNIMENAGLPQLNNKDLYPRFFKVPSLKEQQKIATILSKVDELIQKTDQIIEQTQRLKKGLMQRLLTKGIGQTKFKDVISFFGKKEKIPNNWSVVNLGEIAKIRYGMSQPPEEDEKGIMMIRATNIKRGKIIRENLLRVKVPNIKKDVYLHMGDIIVVRSGVNTGDIGYVTKDFDGCLAGYDLFLTPDKNTNSLFLLYYLLSAKIQNYFSQLKSRVAQEHLNSQQLSQSIIYLPTYEEQREISSCIKNVDDLIEFHLYYKQKMEVVKKGLMRNLLSGKIRVKI